MLLTLPPNTKKLIKRFQNLRIGRFKVVCPYYQNIARRKNKAVFVGKGLPEDIELETIKLFAKRSKNISHLEPSGIRFYMIMADIGIDCSGFVTRILQSLFKEEGVGNLSNNLKPKNNLTHFARYFVRPYTNLSADTITNQDNCIKIQDINKVKPGDLLKVGKSHLAIISEIVKKKNQVTKINYCHSTSDYLDKHGVRKGSVSVVIPNAPLEKQKWDEYYCGRNWMLEDYLKDSEKDQVSL